VSVSLTSQVYRTLPSQPDLTPGESEVLEERTRRIGDRDEVRSLRNMTMIAASHGYMTCAVEGMNVGDPDSVSGAGRRSETELEKCAAYIAPVEV